jgi:hypothetical protein
MGKQRYLEIALDAETARSGDRAYTFAALAQKCKRPALFRYGEAKSRPLL